MKCNFILQYDLDHYNFVTEQKLQFSFLYTSSYGRAVYMEVQIVWKNATGTNKLFWIQRIKQAFIHVLYFNFAFSGKSVPTFWKK